MAAYVQSRQPFAALDGARLQALGSVKNRQNAIPQTNSFSSPIKPTFNTPVKRRAASPDLYDDFDAENVDPNLLLTPSKRSKGLDGNTIVKPAKYILTDAPKSTSTSTPLQQANTSAKRKATLSLSVPAPTTSTPIAHSRGSPKHKRIGLLSRKLDSTTNGRRRFSSSPFRRIDPPSTSTSRQSATALPFSIDAALTGTLTSYTPESPLDAAALAQKQKAMPSSWFFDIHEDSPEEEAANLMEHSAASLDISSDDDSATRRRRDAEERGKENVPPPDFVAPVRGPRVNGAVLLGGEPIVHKGVSDPGRVVAKGKTVEDAMVEDRVALGVLEAQDFYPEGLDEGSVEVIEVVKVESVEGSVTVAKEEVLVTEEVVAVIEASAPPAAAEAIVVCEDGC